MADITIPPEALEAGARALYSVRCKITAVASGARLSDFEPWEGVATNDQDDYRYEARAAIRAAIKAWPRAQAGTFSDNRHSFPAIFLPLPARDEENDNG